MRRVNARIANSCFWILLLHLSPSFVSRIALDERDHATANRWRLI